MARERSDATRLAAGSHLYPAPDGTWRCSLPDGGFIRLGGPDAVLRRLQLHLHGSTTDPTVLVEAADLLDGLEARDLLTTDAHLRPTVDHVVGVEGDDPIAELVDQLLAEHVRVVRGALDPSGRASIDMAVSCSGWLPDARWCDLDRWSAAHNVGWHRVHAEGNGFVIGPCSLPGRTVSYRDTRARRLAAASLPDELLAHWAYLDAGEGLPPVCWQPADAIALIASLLVSDVLASLAGRALPSEGCQLVVDPATGAVRRHPVLALPEPAQSISDATDDTQLLVDPRLGLITKVTRDEAPAGTLRSCIAYTAHVADTHRFSTWSADRNSSGAAFGDEVAARRAATGEAIERYCGNLLLQPLIRASYTELAGTGRRAVDPINLALYSDRQYRSPGFPFVPLTRDLEVAWVQGHDLVDGTEMLVPASLVYLNQPGDPPTNVPALAGIAAGTTVAGATRAALEELLERDAVATWWASGAAPARVDAPPRIDDLLCDPDAAGLNVTFLRIPSEFEVSVLGAYLVDTARQVVALGTACRSSPEEAALKALTEAVGSYRLSLELLDPGAAFWEAVTAKKISPAPYRPFRADRCYRDSFRADWRDMNDLSMHLQIYLDLRMQDEHLGRLAAPSDSVLLAALPAVGPDPRTAYLDMLAAHGLRAVAIDLTTSDVAAAGMHVVRVVVPGLYSIWPAAFPQLGGQRLYRDSLTEDTVVRAPIPFA